jgi:hypothetical protein
MRKTSNDDTITLEVLNESLLMCTAGTLHIQSIFL